MPEPQPRPQRQEPRVLRHVEPGGVQAEQRRRAPQQSEVADGLRRRERHQRPGGGRQPFEAAYEPLLQLGDHPGPRTHRPGDPERPRVMRELQQRQRVAVRLGQDPVEDLGVQPGVRHRSQHRPGVLVAQPRQRQPRKIGEPGPRPGLPRGEHHRDALHRHPPRHEDQRPPRGVVDPLRVVHHTAHRLLLSHLVQQPEHRQPDRQRIGGSPFPDPEHGLQSRPLHFRKPQAVRQMRRAQLMQRRVRQIPLELCPGPPQHREPFQGPYRGIEQRRLAHPGLPGHHERAPTPGSRRAQQPIDLEPFPLPGDELQRSRPPLPVLEPLTPSNRDELA